MFYCDGKIITEHGGNKPTTLPTLYIILVDISIISLSSLCNYHYAHTCRVPVWRKRPLGVEGISTSGIFFGVSYVMTSWHGQLFCITAVLRVESNHERPVMQSLCVCHVGSLNKRMNKRWLWFQTPWRSCDVAVIICQIWTCIFNRIHLLYDVGYIIFIIYLIIILNGRFSPYPSFWVRSWNISTCDMFTRFV